MAIKPPTVFPAEREAGLEHKIRSQSSIAFTAPVATHDPQMVGSKSQLKASAALTELVTAGLDDADVHHVLSILVSTVWNKNDDIFDKDEVWAARETPRFKPTNIEHDEKQIVGGIINSWAIDSDFNLIGDSENPKASDLELPDVYHILVGSVIYKRWNDPELQTRATDLIQQIEAGEKFVSMECVFHGFDYGVVDPDGNNHVVARTADTAFLSQHLRAYGGMGTYQDHKVGRVLRDITFSGKGFVDKPANPDSIIFDKDHIFSFANASEDKSLFLDDNGVNTSTEGNSFDINSHKENTMSDQLNDQIRELKESLASLRTENKDMADKLSAANVSQYEDKIEALTANIAVLDEAKADLEGKLSEATSKVETLGTDVEAKSTELEELQANFDKMKEEEKKKKREASLIEAGIPADEVAAKLETFSSLNDEQFDVIVKTVSDLKPAVSTEASESTTESSEEESVEEETTASEVVEENSVEEDNTSMASESSEGEDEQSVARAGLEQWVSEVVMNQKASE
jgi:hypothetical protein